MFYLLANKRIMLLKLAILHKCVGIFFIGKTTGYFISAVHFKLIGI